VIQLPTKRNTLLAFPIHLRLSWNLENSFAKDIEDYAAGVQRNFNFPEGFLDMTLIYPHVEYKLEHDFGDFKMLGYIDNMSKDYELVVDFKQALRPGQHSDYNNRCRCRPTP
jgi:hypothetical protein